MTGGGISTRPPLFGGEAGDERRHGCAGVSAKSPYLSDVPGTGTMAPADPVRETGVRTKPSDSETGLGLGGVVGAPSVDLGGIGGGSRFA